MCLLLQDLLLQDLLQSCACGGGVCVCVCLLLKDLLQNRTYCKVVRVGGGGEWRTCAMRDDDPRPVWMSLLITQAVREGGGG